MLSTNSLIKLIAVLFLAVTLCCCRLSPDSTITQLPTNSWYKSNYQKIGLVNISYDKNNLNLSYDFLQIVEADVSSYLRSIGYDVEPLSTHYDLQQQMLSDTGGFYDAISGELDYERRSEFNQQFIETYLKQTDVDLMLSINFYRSSGKFKDDEVVWDNMIDRTIYPPALLRSNASGVLPTISVDISAMDPTTGRVVKRTQGVQVILRFHKDLDIHPEDMPLHLKNLRLGLKQLSPV